MKREKIIEDGKTYIQIPYYQEDGQTTIFPEYEMNVLENTKIEGMSKAIRKNLKGEVYFWFPVISYITVKEKFNREHLNKEMFCQFFKELLQVYENMQIYLLDKTLICLEPEYIFFDEKEEKYVFLAIGSEHKDVLDNYENLFVFFADICCVEEKNLLEFIFETFGTLNRSSFDEMDFMKTIIEYQYKKEETNLIENNILEEFEDESECEIEDIPRIKGTLVAGILLLVVAFWFSFMCEEEFRYEVVGVAACLLSICLLGKEVFNNIMSVIKRKQA